MKFKAGDRIRDNATGAQGVVTFIWPDGDVSCQMDGAPIHRDCGNSVFSGDGLELIPSSPKFKIGDVVERLDGQVMKVYGVSALTGDYACEWIPIGDQQRHHWEYSADNLRPWPGPWSAPSVPRPSPKFKVGDVVRLRSGGPNMTVVLVHDPALSGFPLDSPEYNCQWEKWKVIDPLSLIHTYASDSFPEAALVLAEERASGPCPYRGFMYCPFAGPDVCPHVPGPCVSGLKETPKEKPRKSRVRAAAEAVAEDILLKVLYRAKREGHSPLMSTDYIESLLLEHIKEKPVSVRLKGVHPLVLQVFEHSDGDEYQVASAEADPLSRVSDLKGSPEDALTDWISKVKQAAREVFSGEEGPYTIRLFDKVEVSE